MTKIINNQHKKPYGNCALCGYCGTVHKRNELENWKYCEQNDIFKAKLKAHIEYSKKITKEIWSQPEKEVEEEGVESK